MDERTEGGQSAAGAPMGGIGPTAARQLADVRRDFHFADFVTFRYMITPPLITAIYVIGVVLVTIGALAYVNTSALGAVIAWIFLMLYLRVILELIVVLFRINDGIQSMAHLERDK